MRCLLAVIMIFSAQLSLAMSPFQQHLNSTAQSISAFYMYEMTEGDEKFLNEFKQHQADASRALGNSTELQKSLFEDRWQKMIPHWKFNLVKGVGLNFEAVVRLQVRRYLTDLYLYSKELPVNQTIVESKVDTIKVNTSILSARTLDLVSAHNGSNSLTEHDLQLDSKAIAAQVQENIAQLLDMKLEKSQTKSLKKVRTQFNFIEKSLVDHNQVVPYFLVYRNIMRLGKLLDESTQKVAGF